jgi:hypothetical protein
MWQALDIRFRNIYPSLLLSKNFKLQCVCVCGGGGRRLLVSHLKRRTKFDVVLWRILDPKGEEVTGERENYVGLMRSLSYAYFTK